MQELSAAAILKYKSIITSCFGLVFLPLFEKSKQIFLHHPARRFEFALAAAIEQFSIASQDRDGRHALFERSLVLLHQIQILVAFTDIHVNQDKTILHQVA